MDSQLVRISGCRSLVFVDYLHNGEDMHALYGQRNNIHSSANSDPQLAAHLREVMHLLAPFANTFTSRMGVR